MAEFMRDEPQVRLMLRSSSFALLLVVVFVAPFPLGSSRDWAWTPLALLVGLALLLHGSSAWPPALRLHGSASMAVSAGAFSIVLAWAMVQAMGWGHPHRLQSFFQGAEAALDLHFGLRGAVDSEKAFGAVLRLAAYGGVFWLASQFGRDRRHAQTIHLTLLTAAFIVAMYGWAMQVAFRSCVVVTVVQPALKNDDPCLFSATFLNSDAYCDYAGLAGLLCLARLHDILLQARTHSASTRERWHARLVALGGRGSLYLAALIVLIGSAVYSASRSGLLSLMAAAMGMTALTAILNRHGRGAIFQAWAGVVLVIAIVFVIGGETVARRFIVLFAEGDTERLGLYRLTMDAISLHPWTGWGLDSFGSIYSVFQQPFLTLTFDSSHNTYLESALELGIPVSACLVVAIAAPVVRCVRGLRERVRDTHFCAAGVGGAILFALHSLTDFGVQIPAVAIGFSAVLGVGWAQSWSSRRTEVDRTPTPAQA